MLKAIERHALTPVIDRVSPFADLRAALDYLKAGRLFGKACIAI